MKTYTFKIVEGLKIQADAFVAAHGKNAPVILWIHGGALIGGHRNNIKADQLKFYLDAGYAVVSIDYRLAPETKLAGIIEDVRDAYCWLYREGPGLLSIDPDRIAVIGHSAGGYLTLMTGFCVEPPPKALVSFYGYGDIVGPWYSQPDPFYCAIERVPKEEAHAAIRDRAIPNDEGYGGRGRFYLYCRQNGLWPNEVAGCDPKTEPEAFIPFCPIRNVTPEYPPTMLLHGTKDTDVPYQQSAMMAEELARAGVEHEFVTITDGGHVFDGHGLREPFVADAFDRALAFLRKHV